MKNSSRVVGEEAQDVVGRGAVGRVLQGAADRVHDGLAVGEEYVWLGGRADPAASGQADGERPVRSAFRVQQPAQDR